MKSEIKDDYVFFRDVPQFCRIISEILDKNVYSLKSANEKCVSRLFEYYQDTRPLAEHLCNDIANYIKLNDLPISVGLLSYSISKTPEKYKIVVVGELG
jgi:hypothetical protein